LFAETQAELSNASHLAALGELAGSIVHDVNQPVSALITSAEACRCWL
jgi:two-component system sensor kinase FixL